MSIDMIERVFEFAKTHPSYSIPIGVTLGFINDYMYAKYLQAATDNRPFTACNWSLAITILCLGLTISLIQGAILMVVSYLVGGYAGTWVATRKKTMTEETRS